MGWLPSYIQTYSLLPWAPHWAPKKSYFYLIGAQTEDQAIQIDIYLPL